MDFQSALFGQAFMIQTFTILTFFFTIHIARENYRIYFNLFYDYAENTT